MKNHWLERRIGKNRGINLLATSNHKVLMWDFFSILSNAVAKDDSKKKQIDAFIDEVGKAYFDRGETDFKYLYDKYPRVRICARRAILTARKRRGK